MVIISILNSIITIYLDYCVLLGGLNLSFSSVFSEKIYIIFKGKFCGYTDRHKATHNTQTVLDICVRHGLELLNSVHPGPYT